MFATETAGDLLRSWRRRRGKTQLDIACEADVPTSLLRHLEAGKGEADAESMIAAVLLAAKLAGSRHAVVKPSKPRRQPVGRQKRTRKGASLHR